MGICCYDWDYISLKVNAFTNFSYFFGHPVNKTESGNVCYISELKLYTLSDNIFPLGYLFSMIWCLLVWYGMVCRYVCATFQRKRYHSSPAIPPLFSPLYGIYWYGMSMRRSFSKGRVNTPAIPHCICPLQFWISF